MTAQPGQDLQPEARELLALVEKASIALADDASRRTPSTYELLGDLLRRIHTEGSR